MVNRAINLSKSRSFFLFGARGTGKTSLLQQEFVGHPGVLYIDLLKPSKEDLYRLYPETLAHQIEAETFEWVIVDEIQKLPKLLDLVHHAIVNKRQKFILTGSSARKLKRGAANLLAGRASVYHLYPFTARELGDDFDLQTALEWGLLPEVWNLKQAGDRAETLYAYALTYLKEEVQAEQFVRKLDPFRKFLEVAAQSNGKIVNFSKIGNDVGVDTTTVQNYFSILEDTLLGFILPSYHKSVRKRQREAPKFYFFDPGVVRALSRTLDVHLVPKTYAYGESFEHFVILEIRKLAEYARKKWEFYYLRTKDDVEIDLLIDIPKRPTVCIEIKSSSQVTRSDLRSFIAISADMKNIRAICLSNDPVKKKIDHVECFHWREGIEQLGL
ncbi:MAG: ATP-binding protein [Pseudobdellovibrionaceae bacterium]|nr:ATP-binding protein [Bdellovibrionales bacterium]USN47799.1 MAG: ATP-binding protein [Pseudobdellovibrionaceae bacterium]